MIFFTMPFIYKRGKGVSAVSYTHLDVYKRQVISIRPTYQQLYSIPESYGADVQLIDLKKENGYLPDIEMCIRDRLIGVVILPSLILSLIFFGTNIIRKCLKNM